MSEAKEYKCGCVLLAAGLGSRFGGGKLHADVDGISMIDRALDTLSAAKMKHVAVVSADKRILDAARKHGFSPVLNDAPEEGISRSIRLGIEAMGGADALMFMVADQPLLTKESIVRLVEAHSTFPRSIAALSSGGKRGNPCVFPRELFDELCALSGDRGGSVVIERHSERLLLVEAEERELVDVDDRETLAGLSARSLYPKLSIRLFTSDTCFGPGIAHLLCLVRETGSLRSAAASMNMSYSKAWTSLSRCEELLGFSLLLRSAGGKNGGGAKLTPEAEKLLADYRAYCGEVEAEAEKLFEKYFSSY